MASLIGSMISYLPGVQYGALHYRYLEREKIIALKQNRGNFNATMTVSSNGENEIKWWMHHANECVTRIDHGESDYELFTDASNKGWGASYDGHKTGGHWDMTETPKHKNVLELLAVFYGLKSFFHDYKSIHIKARVDNTTAVTYIKNMGGVKSMDCFHVTKLIWEWCIKRDIWLSCTHISGSDNKTADELSRVFNDQTEWMLDKHTFDSITKVFITPEIDMFASRLNTQLANYVSWCPDPGALATDAFSISWKQHLSYMFPPFSLLTKTLQRIEMENAEAIVVAPMWPTQTWFPKILRLLIDFPLLLPRKQKTLTLPFEPTRLNPLHKKIQLMACHVSGPASASQAFRQLPRKSSSIHGKKELKNNIAHTLSNGQAFVVDGTSIPCIQLCHKQ